MRANPSDTESLAGLILSAGLGTRLRPLTERTPKPLVQVGGRPLLDLAIDALPLPAASIAVNASYLADQIVQHLEGTGVHVVVEPTPLGSAGAVANLRSWIGGRDLMIRNADVWFSAPPVELWRGWDRLRPRLLVQEIDGAADFGTLRFLGWSMLPRRAVATLPTRFGGLFDRVWRDAYARGDIEFVRYEGVAIDCGTLTDLEHARDMAARLQAPPSPDSTPNR